MTYEFPTWLHKAHFWQYTNPLICVIFLNKTHNHFTYLPIFYSKIKKSRRNIWDIGERIELKHKEIAFRIY